MLKKILQVYFLNEGVGTGIWKLWTTDHHQSKLLTRDTNSHLLLINCFEREKGCFFVFFF